jgi:hypothetical protein
LFIAPTQVFIWSYGCSGVARGRARYWIRAPQEGAPRASEKKNFGGWRHIPHKILSVAVRYGEEEDSHLMGTEGVTEQGRRGMEEGQGKEGEE